MRADRLIALLLLLQRKGRVTAAEVAEELEVSARTARRDLEALAMSGVPVYSTHGRGGGWELIGGASTDLTGLSSEEARALFLAAGPAVTSTQELKSALRKLTSALPTPFQAEAEAATSAFKIDRSGWGQVERHGQPRFLDQLTDAVVQGRQIDLDYESRRSTRRIRRVHPLGLVTKRNVWYLVAASEPKAGDASRGNGGGPIVGGSTDDDIRTYRVGRVLGVATLDLPAIRPPSFDLDNAWANIVTEVERQRSTIRVKLRVDPALLVPLRWTFGAQLVTIDDGAGGDGYVGKGDAADPSDPENSGRTERTTGAWLQVTIDAHSERSFAAQIAGFGLRAEILEAPDGVFTELATLADELHRAYCR